MPTRAAEEAPSWDYGGAENPSQWGRLGKDFALCETGRDQSPIDIRNAVDADPIPLEFSYAPTAVEVVDNGHTIQVNYPEGNTVSINGEVFDLLQFHFHTPSEHQIAGRAAAMAVHFVHRNEAGTLAVVGVLMDKGTTHPVIDQIWKSIPEKEESKAVEGIEVNPGDLLPAGESYYSYAGSLTTPPCSEEVRWHVLTESIQVSEEQLETFEKLYQVNARPIQPTNGRVIKHHNHP